MRFWWEAVAIQRLACLRGRSFWQQSGSHASKRPWQSPPFAGTVLNGPTCWPADGNHLVGPTRVPGFWHACAESYGIAHSQGLGRYLAEWITNGAPPYELNETDPSRKHLQSGGQESFYGRRIMDGVFGF